MGLLIEGQWRDQWYDTDAQGGEFVRENAAFRNWITADGSPGPTGDGGFAAEPGRYHLFVSPACPWSHRTLIFLALKRLENVVGVTAVDPKMLRHGWEFSEVSHNNPLPELSYLHQVYTQVDPRYTGRVTVPLRIPTSTPITTPNRCATRSTRSTISYTSA